MLMQTAQKVQPRLTLKSIAQLSRVRDKQFHTGKLRQRPSPPEADERVGLFREISDLHRKIDLLMEQRAADGEIVENVSPVAKREL